MKVFLDANILVSVLNKEYPLFTLSARIVSLAGNKRFTVYTSPLCLAIAFYFAEKKSGSQVAKNKISILSQQLSITDINKQMVQDALNNKKINDFEDGLEYYAARAAGCECIVTEDKNDFYFSEIETLNATRFFEKYMLRSS